MRIIFCVALSRYVALARIMEDQPSIQEKPLNLAIQEYWIAQARAHPHYKSIRAELLEAIAAGVEKKRFVLSREDIAIKWDPGYDGFKSSRKSSIGVRIARKSNWFLTLMALNMMDHLVCTIDVKLEQDDPNEQRSTWFGGKRPTPLTEETVVVERIESVTLDVALANRKVRAVTRHQKESDEWLGQLGLYDKDFRVDQRINVSYIVK